MKKALALTLIMALLMSAVAGTQFVDLTRANYYSKARYSGELSSVPDTEPPRVLIFSPENNVIYNTDNVYLTFDASVGQSTLANSSDMHISTVYYKADWQENITSAYRADEIYQTNFVSDFSYSLNLTGIPEGNHSIIVYATERGTYFASWLSFYGFSINGSSSVFFTIDTPPSIQVLSPRIETYNATSVPLNFVLNESVAQMSYSLDGQENVTVAGNTTLSALRNGVHNVTLYAQDNYGNIGNSETIVFTVEEPEPELFPTAYSMGFVAVIVLLLLGLTVYILKRKD